MLFFRSILVVFLVLCLPLQGMAAVALPIGMSHDTQLRPASHDMDMHGVDIQTMDEMPDHCMQAMQKDASDHESESNSTCDQCFTCHLTVAQALLPVPAVLPVAGAEVENSLSPGEKIAALAFPFFRPPISA